MMVDHYDWPGGREAMLRFGPADGPVVVVAMPLLEEWNRTRAFVVTLLRMLADRRVASVLPDLPGTGESIVATVDARLATWRAAFAAAAAKAAGKQPIAGTLSLRSGALIDQAAPAPRRWRLSPSTGPEVSREFDRLQSLGEKARHSKQNGYGETGVVSLLPDAPTLHEIAGNLIHPELLAAIGEDDTVESGSHIRIVRLESDARPAHRKVAGRPLWRAAEPGNDAAFAAVLASDITDWLATCAA